MQNSGMGSPPLIRAMPERKRFFLQLISSLITKYEQVDSDYEFCKWVSPRDRYCDFEWKRASGNITTQDCQIADKVSFHGRYNDRECGIRINSASVEDTGTWRLLVS